MANVGEIWKEKDKEVTWRIVAILPEVVGLSGPGPLRQYKVEPLTAFNANWEKVSDQNGEQGNP